MYLNFHKFEVDIEVKIPFEVKVSVQVKTLIWD